MHSLHTFPQCNTKLQKNKNFFIPSTNKFNIFPWQIQKGTFPIHWKLYSYENQNEELTFTLTEKNCRNQKQNETWVLKLKYLCVPCLTCFHNCWQSPELELWLEKDKEFHSIVDPAVSPLENPWTAPLSGMVSSLLLCNEILLIMIKILKNLNVALHKKMIFKSTTSDDYHKMLPFIQLP